MAFDWQPEIEIKLLDERLRHWGLPRYQSEMAAAIDLHACLAAPLSLPAGEPAVLIAAGFALHLASAQVAAIILPRSGLGHKKGLVLGNALGLIDADYQGPVMISAWNRNAADSAPIVIEPGERIAQMTFVPILRPQLRPVADFTSPSARGVGGFGSTGSGAG